MDPEIQEYYHRGLKFTYQVIIEGLTTDRTHTYIGPTTKPIEHNHIICIQMHFRLEQIEET